VVVGFVGMIVVVRPDPATILDPTVVGKLLFLTGVTIVALGTVLVRRSESGMPIPTLTAWAMVLGGTVHLTFAIAVGESLAQVRPTPLALSLVVYLALVVGAVGFVTFFAIMGEVGALKANLTTYLTPIVALVLGWLLLAEAIQPLTLVGFAIIVAGFALLESREIAAELSRYRTLYR
jgi:drug/metabolite transporter (DMT)-like permease